MTQQELNDQELVKYILDLLDDGELVNVSEIVEVEVSTDPDDKPLDCYMDKVEWVH